MGNVNHECLNDLSLEKAYYCMKIMVRHATGTKYTDFTCLDCVRTEHEVNVTINTTVLIIW